MKKLALILAVLFLFSTPALATSVDDLISELESELTAVPDLSSAFGSVGEAQGEVFATGVITGEGTLYEDDGIGSAGADLLLLQQGFSASAVLVAQRAGTLYVRGAASVLILPQIIPGQTLVIVGGESLCPAETARPHPAPVVYNAVSLNIGGVTTHARTEHGHQHIRLAGCQLFRRSRAVRDRPARYRSRRCAHAAKRGQRHR